MEQSPVLYSTFHIRIVSLLTLLLTIDTVLANHAIHATMTKGPSMMIMFGFEYTILICIIASTIGKYIINIIDMRSEQTWEGKSMFVFYLDLVTDFFKLITYSLFFVYICLNYQLPLHIVRDIYVTFRSFIQKCTDLYRYRRATRNMNELYPDATPEDFGRSNDNTCIICREEMHITDPSSTPNEVNAEADPNRHEQNLDQPKKLPCGHVFHFHCLRSWLERQQTCPTCRRSVLADTNTTPSENNNVQDQAPAPAPAAPQPNAAENNTFNGPHHEQSQTPFSGTQTGQPSLFNTSLNGQIPAMIPLTPFTPAAQAFAHQDSLPSDLTEDQLRTMSKMTRKSLQEKLRLLGQVQNQIFHSMQILTQVLSITPDLETKSEDLETYNQGESSKPEGLGDQVEEESGKSRRREKMPDRTQNTTLASEEEEEAFALSN
ncbi:E3 ubiquitin-protein ligase hrd1 [Rhizopus stolonifer]|uniref:RING-type E3 ubiquitin transferase n=1 Tax=Rhizopus stolonifer TaxID=4846 RepID=A0A367JHA4_RHIST|nr:E3 ubiquitin-protein ligase hrd1 [Rhizopus stolonifer]